MAVIQTPGLDHVDLTVTDLARSVEFYGELLPALGFRRLLEEDQYVWATAHLSIAIRPADESQRPVAFNRFRAGLHHLAFRALSRADVDRFHEYLVAQSPAVILDPPQEYPLYGAGYYAVFFSDPDGIKLELVHRP
jgi:catechol 2,3-dioxygenase-like lactoylglutathione lyase family enzyme